jgi:hypothetical protein
LLGIAQNGVREDGGPFVELRRPDWSSRWACGTQLDSSIALPPKLLAVRAARCLPGRTLDPDHPAARCTGCARRGDGPYPHRIVANTCLARLIARTGRPQDRATIAGHFWPESGNGQALTNLRRELHDLRRIQGEDDSLEITPVSSSRPKAALRCSDSNGANRKAKLTAPEPLLRLPRRRTLKSWS